MVATDRGVLARYMLAALLLSICGKARAEEERPFITVATTTSTENSGLMDWLKPRFANAAGIDLRVVAVGTGQALRLGQRGDADVVLVHHRISEAEFVAAGHGVDRRDVMYNDFVLVGPAADPAGVAKMTDIARAFATVGRSGSPFISRGDDSGTHRREREIWSASGLSSEELQDSWYRECGCGMGTALNIACQSNAYLLADRGTWLSFKNRRGLKILVEGDVRLHNPYGAILVNPTKHPHVKEKEARAFLDWLTSEPGRDAIGSYRLEGQPLFHPARPVKVDKEEADATPEKAPGEDPASDRSGE